jgi:phosphate transport system substrate-binding protein
VTRATLVHLLAAAFLLAGLTGCAKDDSKGGGSSSSGAKASLRGAGSSFVKPIMDKWVAGYTKAKGGEINYQATGSTQGIENMIDKSVDFGATDAFMSQEQLDKARDAKGGGTVLHVPLVMGGIVPAYNVKGVDRPINFTGEALADIYLGNIKKWSELKKIKGNEDLNLPDENIAVVSRSDGSGSTSIFTEYLCKVSPEFKSKVGQGTKVKFPIGSAEKGTSGISGFLEKAANSIGYIELSYALQHKLSYGNVQNRAKKFVRCDVKSVRAAAEYALKNAIPEDFHVSITDASGDESYPLAGTTWAVFYTQQPRDTGAALVDIFTWVIHEGQKEAESLQYTPLPAALVSKIDAKLKVFLLD